MSTPDQTLLQISDAHLEREPGSADDRLDEAVAMVDASGLAVAAVLVTGDLSEDGSPESYRRLRARLDPLAARLAAPLIVLPGNHDDVATLRAEMVAGEPVDRVVELDGLRVVTLDSTVAGVHHGELTDDQLEWLADALAVRSPRGTILALHHPPIPSVHPVLDRLALREPERLAATIARTDVRLVVCGHAHAVSTATIAGVPVWSGPALAATTDVLPPEGRARSLRGRGGLSRIDLFGDTTVASFLPLVPQPDLIYDEPLDARLATLDQLERAVTG